MFTRSNTLAVTLATLAVMAVVVSTPGCQSPDAAKPTVSTVDPTVTQDPRLPSSARPGLPGVANPDVSASAPIVPPSPRVDKIELASLPVVANMDDKPGADGVSVTVRLYNLDQPLAFALKTGVIEFVLYEGNIKEAEIGGAKPFHTWRFSAEQAAKSGRKTIIGWQYAMSLNWLDHSPTSSAVTLIARIPRPSATPLYARPVHLAMGPR